MTCWSCKRELSASWDRCPACAALSLENVERVAKGVASMAVRVVSWLVTGADEQSWGVRVFGTHSVTATHPASPVRTLPNGQPDGRHGAALAAFEAAWEAGLRTKERRKRAAYRTVEAAAKHIAAGMGYRPREAAHWKAKMEAEPELKRVRRVSLGPWPDDEDREPPRLTGVTPDAMVIDEVSDFKAGDLVAIDEHGQMRKATPMDECALRVPDPDPQAIVDEWCAEHGVLAEMPSDGGIRVTINPEFSLAPIDLRPVGSWWEGRDFRGCQCRGDFEPVAEWFHERALYCGIPTHVVDAMVALAREALAPDPLCRVIPPDDAWHGTGGKW